MLDTFRGLPVHVLVIHAVVIGVPLMALVTTVVAFVPRWRARLAWPVAVVDALLVGVTFVAKESGEKLLDRIGSSPAVDRHVELGDKMLWFTIGLLVAAVLVALVRNLTGAVPVVVGVLVLAASLAATGWVVRTGEAGSDAVWKDVVANTTPGG
ncbi:hypothetical protein GCM10027446_30520 [Angustibacter peucedani]